MKTETRRRLLGAGALAAIAALGLTACASGGTNSDKTELVLQVAYTPNLTEEVWQGFVDGFEAENPDISVKLISGPDSGGAPEYTKQLVAAGTPPDLTMSPSLDSDFLEILQPFDITDDIKAIDGWEQGLIDGKLYQLPSFALQPTSLMFYNKALFEQAGITEEPTTWDEFNQVAETLKSQDVAPIVMAGEWVPGYVLKVMGPLNAWPDNRPWYTEYRDGEHAFDDGGWLEAADELGRWYKDGWLNQGGLGDAYAQGEQNFLNGAGAMYPMGSWFTVAAEDAGTDFGVFPIPSADSAERIAANFSSLSPAVLASTKHPEAALKLAQYFAFNEDVVNGRLEADGLFGSGAKYEMTPLQQEIHELLAQDDVIVSSNGLGGNIPDPEWTANLDAAASAILVGTDPKDAMHTVEASARP